MLKVDNITSSQNILNYYTKTSNSETTAPQKITNKDVFIKSTNDKDLRYSFSFINNTKDSNNYKIIDSSKTNSILVNGSKNITNLIGPDIEKVSYSPTDEFSGDLAYQLLININKDAKRQIKILDKYNLFNTMNLVSSLKSSQPK
jgi:hypothetical protein